MGRTWDGWQVGVREELAQIAGLGDLGVTQPNCTYGEGHGSKLGTF